MRTISDCLKLKSSLDMTTEEMVQFHIWLDEDARYTMDSYSFCCLLGWYLLDDANIPLSPKEAGFE